MRPNSELAPAATISTANNFADMIEAAVHLYRLKIGRLAGDLAGMAAGFFDEHVELAPDHCTIERVPLLLEAELAAATAVPPSPLPEFESSTSAAGVPGRAEYLNENALANCDLFDQIQASRSKSSSVSPGKPTMKSEDRGDVGPRPADFGDKRDIVGALVPAIHGGKHFIRTGLHRQMQERHQAGLIPMRVNETRIHVAWMARRVADARDAGHLCKLGAEHGQRCRAAFPVRP